jgi:hypothetical protein
LLWLVLFPGGVFLVIHLYRRRRPGPLKTGHGARMGMVIALLTFAVLAIYVVASYAHDPAAYRQGIENALKEAAARNPNPDAAQVTQFLTTPGGIGLLITILMAILLGFSLVVGAVSGALAASLRRDRAP